MARLKLKVVKTVHDARMFVHDEIGYVPYGIDAQLNTEGYYQTDKYHIVYDPEGLIKTEAPRKPITSRLLTWIKYALFFIPALAALLWMMAKWDWNDW